MPLQIDWQESAAGERALLHLPLAGAELTITLMGDVIIDATWIIPESDSLPTDSELASQIQCYLHAPQHTQLQLQLLKQGTVYSHKVWLALLDIPLGQKMSYSALAHKLGSGPRAIARACRNNPYAGLIPCHRVVAKSGLGGFMGQSSGPLVELKQQLLEYELELALNRL